MSKPFTDQELAVFQCFINPKYPLATRTLVAVCKETNLSENQVMAIVCSHPDFFCDLQDGWIAFNFLFFAVTQASEYPQLFSEYTVVRTPNGSAVISKQVTTEQVSGILNNTDAPPEVTNLLKSVLAKISPPQLEVDNNDPGIICIAV